MASFCVRFLQQTLSPTHEPFPFRLLLFHTLLPPFAFVYILHQTSDLHLCDPETHVCPLISLGPSGKPDLVLLDDVGELSGPHEAVVWRDEQETVAAVQGGRSGFYQPGLDVPPA